MGDRREQIQRQMELVMGRLPDSSQRVPLAVEVVSTEQADRYTRIKLTYAAEPGDRVPAWLLIPMTCPTRAGHVVSTSDACRTG